MRQVRNILFLSSLAQAVQEIYLALRVLAFSTAGSPITSITMASKTRIKRPSLVAIALIILGPPPRTYPHRAFSVTSPEYVDQYQRWD